MNQYPKGSRYIGIFTCIDHKIQPNVGKYASPMDPMGIILLYHTSSLKILWMQGTCKVTACWFMIPVLTDHRESEELGFGFPWFRLFSI